VWDALTRADPGPVAVAYVVTAEDVKGPFIGLVPATMEALAKLDHMGFTGPAQLLAETFHMDQALLAALNPGVDLGVAGATLVVTAPGAVAAAPTAARVEVDKSAGQVRVLDQAGRVVAVFPATVGSADRPAPSGTWAVRDIAHDPAYTFDPARLTFGRSKRKLTIHSGPNNPVGSTWIGLTKDTYGIHGAPDPALVGKTASHGCVRLTNWDARRLAGMVGKGTPVIFVGQAAR
jgi:lipoprotein-anchoring transpeptidase ErfK/SrfK